MDLENAKENIQPLAAGRNASILHASLQADSPQELSVRRHELEQAIHSYKGDDPLEAWFEYILWIEQSYPSGGNGTGFAEVLTKCLLLFENEIHYSQDERLVKLFIKFIETQNYQRPAEFYELLYNAGIATMVADFYISWAYCYDLIGNFRKANEIFQRGIDCRATPLEVLQEAHTHYQCTVSKRFMYKVDEDISQTAIKELHERRQALSSLRSHRKRVGSVRTGAAIKSYEPGTLKVDINSMRSKLNSAVTVLNDENAMPSAEGASAALHLDESDNGETNSKSVVRCILNLARNEENKIEPGPWNKAHDKQKGKLFGKGKLQVDCGFDILEDDSFESPKNNSTKHINIDLTFKPFPNFKSSNSALPVWFTPVTTENEPQPRSYPQYNKCKLYPRPNLEFQMEELRVYTWFQKRCIHNNFTRERDEVWKSYEIGSVRQYPNFAKQSRQQALDHLDVFFKPEKFPYLKVCFDEIYNNSDNEELQIEEILAKNVKNGKRKLKFNGNETITMATEMEETVCASPNAENRRKSFFPFAAPVPISKAPKGTLALSPELAGSFSKTQEKKLEKAIERCRIEDDGHSEKPSTSTAAISYAPAALSAKNDSFEFKTPPLPITSNKANIKFDIYEESMEQKSRSPTRNQDTSEFFEADETCNTQGFNFFIKAQSVSTPKMLQKTMPRVFGSVLQEITQKEEPVQVPTNVSADMKVELGLSPQNPKQLSTILETSEQGTNTKSSLSFSEFDAHGAWGGIGHKHLETLKEQTCESNITNSRIMHSLTENAPKGTQLQPSIKMTSPPPHADDAGVQFSIFEDRPEIATLPKEVGNLSHYAETQCTTTDVFKQPIKNNDQTEISRKILITQNHNTQDVPSLETIKTAFAAQPNDDIGVQFLIFEDHSETAILPKEIGNFSRFEERQDTMTDFLKQPIKFQEDKTETNHKMLITSKQDVKFQDDQTETVSKIFSTTAQRPEYQDNTENKLPFHLPPMDDSFQFFLQTPPKSSNPQSVPTSKRSLLNTSDLNKGDTPHKQATKFRCTYNTPKSGVNFAHNPNDSYDLTDFSIVADSQPIQQPNIMELKNARAQKSVNSMKNVLRDSFALPDFSMVMNSQPTHESRSKDVKHTNHDLYTHEHILTHSFMKDFSTVKEQLPEEDVVQTCLKTSDNCKQKNNMDSRYQQTCSSQEQNNVVKQNVSYGLDNVSPSAYNVNFKEDYFCEHEDITLTLSMAENSMWMSNNLRQTHIQKKSLHIKEEYSPIHDVFYEKSNEISNPPTVERNLVQPKPSSSVFTGSSEKNNEQNSQKSSSLKVDDDNEMSVYIVDSPKTPKIKRHIWNESNDGSTFHGGYIHRATDMNATQQITEDLVNAVNVNPFNSDLITAFLDHIDFTNFIDDLPNCELIGKVSQLHKDSIVKVNDVSFKVNKVIGEGAYGVIYCVTQKSTGQKYALKQERPPNYWEYYICLEVKSRLQIDELVPAFMNIEYALIGNNSSIYLSKFSPYGSILSVCQKIKKVTTKNVDEYVTMHLTLLLLDIMDHLHALEIIHADIKADNFLLMKKLSYEGNEKSIQLIDFGVSIDMRLFKKGQSFSYVHKDNAIRCVEMRENRQWTYQIDLFGLAGVIHVLLFGKYMDVSKNPNGVWMHKTRVPRYINKTLWDTIFTTLLNIRDCGSMPKLQKLRVMLKEELANKESTVMNKILEFNRALDY